MLKVDITKEVIKKRESSKKDAVNIVKETQLLLEGDAQQEREILKKIGLGHQIKKAERVNVIDLERKTFETEYGGEVVMQEHEIKELCIKYDLKFLPTEKFKGHTDLNIGPRIRRFVEKNNINPSKGDFFIMAPGKTFNLEDRPKPVKDSDPILFYKIPNNTEERMFVMVHKWGNDFTIFRRLRGLVLENVTSFVISHITIGFFVALLGCNLLDNDYSIGIGNIILSSLIAIAYAGILLLIRAGGDRSGRELNDVFNVNLWNSIYKK